MKIIVLGAGLVGRPMAEDLALEPGFEVTVADINEVALEKINNSLAISKIKKDLADPADIKKLVEDYDFVVNAVPGFMGYKTLEAIIQAGRNVVDISFFPEDPFQLDELAKDKQIGRAHV